MANTLRFKRGLVSGIPTAAAGEPLFTTDTFDLYIGNGTTNTRFQKYIASGTTSQLLRGDGSLLTMPIVLTSPANGQVLKYDGTNWVNSADAGVTGSGTAGQVTYWGSSSTITGSNNLFWDATNSRLGIGTTSPLHPLDVTSAGNTILYIRSGTSTSLSRLVFGTSANTDRGFIDYNNTSGSRSMSFKIAETERMLLDNSGNLGLGVVPSTWAASRSKIEFSSAGTTAGFVGCFAGSSANNQMGLGSNAYFNASSVWTYSNTGGAAGYYAVKNNVHEWHIAPSGTAGNAITFTQAMTLTANGRLLLGTTTEGTQRLQVQGDATILSGTGNTTNYLSIGDTQPRLLLGYSHASGITNNIISAQVTSDSTGNLLLSSRTNNASGVIFYTNSATTATERMRIDANGSVGIGTTSLTGITFALGKNITGGATAFNIHSFGTIQSDVLSSTSYYSTLARTQATAFTLGSLRHFFATQDTLGAGSAITNQFGFAVGSSLTSATNNYGFYSDIASGTGRWNLYMNGTAANWINGTLSIGGATTTNVKAEINYGTNALINGASPNATTSLTLSASDPGTTANGFGTLLQFRPIQNRGGVVAIGAINTSSAKDSSVSLVFYRNSGNGQIEEAARIDGGGTIGIRVVPNAAFSSYIAVGGSALQMIGGVLLSDTNTFSVSQNIAFNGASYSYITSAAATTYQQTLGTHRWSYVASGTAGNTFTFTEAMRLHNSGNLTLGGTTSTDSGEKLQVNGTMKVTGASTFGGDATIQLAQPTLNLTSTDTTQFSDIGFRESGSLKAVVQFINSAFSTTARQNRLEIGGTLVGGLALVADGSFTTPNLLISSTGAATFSSSVTATIFANTSQTAFLLNNSGANNDFRMGTASSQFRIVNAANTTALLTMTDAGVTTFSSSVTSTQFRLSALNTAPATASSTGTLGEIRIDADHIYVCTATNTWKRVAIATF